MIDAVTYILENDPVVQGLVGNNKANNKHKVYPIIVPQTEVEPYIAVRMVSRVSLGKNCGHQYTIQVASYTLSYDDTTALSQAVIDVLDGHEGGTINGVEFGWLNFLEENDQNFGVDRISITHEHPVYARVATFTGVCGEINT